MAFDYAYGIRLDSEGSPTALSTVATNVRIMPEVYAPQRARPSRQANRHGSVLESRTFFDSFSFVLQVDADYDVPEDAATVYANVATILRRANHNLERVWLTRTAPEQSDVEIPVVVTRPPQTSNPRHRLRIPFRTLDPFWRDRAETFAAVDPTSGVTTGGSAPIGDAVLAFSGEPTSATLTHTTTGDSITIAADSQTNDVIVDCADRSVIRAGVPLDGVMTADKPWLIELLAAQLNSFTLSGSGAVTLTARDKWF